MMREKSKTDTRPEEFLLEDGMELGDGSRMVVRQDSDTGHNEEIDTVEAEMMDPSLWRSIAEDILDRILAWLPFDAFARARAVCHRWNHLVQSPNFCRTYTSVPTLTHPACFLMFDAKDWSTCWLYNPLRNHWHSFPFRFQPGDSKFPCAAAGGLLCFCGVSSYPNLFVCNPLSKAWRKIPSMSYNRFPNLVGMVVNKLWRSYKIVVAGDYHGEHVRSTEVFDSAENSWVTMAGCVPSVNLTPRNAYCQGTIYWLTGDPFGLIAFDLEQGEWKTIQAPMPIFLVSPHLVEYNGRLVMVGGVKEHITQPSIRIWQLELGLLNWEEVARMPSILHKLFLKDSLTGDFMCIGHNELLCFTGYKCSQALLYNLSKKIWQWLPSCPFLSVIDIYRLHIGLSFTPRWDVEV